MTTQGIVSLVNEQGETLIKAICGCNGYNAEKLAEWLKQNPTLDLFEIHRKALELDFGCSDDLVVMSANDVRFLGDDELPEVYRQTFNNPKWNPRWQIGTAPYCEVVVVAGVPTPRALDVATPCAHRYHAEDDNDFICIDCGARMPRQQRNPLGRHMADYRVCKICSIHHYENCGSCFGFGVYSVPDRPDEFFPVSAVEAIKRKSFRGDLRACSECGSTVLGLPVTKHRV